MIAIADGWAFSACAGALGAIVAVLCLRAGEVLGRRRRRLELRLLLLAYTADRSGRDLARMHREAFERDISYGSLYTTLRRLEERGLMARTVSQDQDGTVHYFRTTALGWQHATQPPLAGSLGS